MPASADVTKRSTKFGAGSHKASASSRSILPGRRHRYIRPSSSRTPRQFSKHTAEVDALLECPLVPGASDALPVGSRTQALEASIGQAATEDFGLSKATSGRYALGESVEIEQAARHVKVIVYLLLLFRILHAVGDFLASSSIHAHVSARAVALVSFQLLILLCGFHGARSRSRSFTNGFVLASLCFAIAGIVSRSILVYRVAGLKGDCKVEQDSRVKQVCETWAFASGITVGADILVRRFLMVFGLTGDVGLNLLGFYFGRTLLKLQSAESARIPALVTPTPPTSKLFKASQPAMEECATPSTAAGALSDDADAFETTDSV